MEDKPLKDSGSVRTFPGGAVRDAATGKGRFDLLPMTALELLAKHYEKGALKYGENNWRKGMPISAMLDSGMRHLAKAIRGDTDEDHLVAAAWNIMCAIETRELEKGKAFSHDFNTPAEIHSAFGGPYSRLNPTVTCPFCWKKGVPLSHPWECSNRLTPVVQPKTLEPVEISPKTVGWPLPEGPTC